MKAAAADLNWRRGHPPPDARQHKTERGARSPSAPPAAGERQPTSQSCPGTTEGAALTACRKEPRNHSLYRVTAKSHLISLPTTNPTHHIPTPASSPPVSTAFLACQAFALYGRRPHFTIVQRKPEREPARKEEGYWGKKRTTRLHFAAGRGGTSTAMEEEAPQPLSSW